MSAEIRGHTLSLLYEMSHRPSKSKLISINCPNRFSSFILIYYFPINDWHSCTCVQICTHLNARTHIRALWYMYRNIDSLLSWQWIFIRICLCCRESINKREIIYIQHSDQNKHFFLTKNWFLIK